MLQATFNLDPSDLSLPSTSSASSALKDTASVHASTSPESQPTTTAAATILSFDQLQAEAQHAPATFLANICEKDAASACPGEVGSFREEAQSFMSIVIIKLSTCRPDYEMNEPQN